MAERSAEQVVVNALKDFVEEHREFLIIESGPYYVQFAPIYPDGEQRGERDAGRSFSELYAEHGLYAEAVSDEYLEPGARLGEDGAARLQRLGWSPPSDQPNWSRFLDLKDETGYAEIAGCVVSTFVDGFGTTEPFRFEAGEPIDRN